MSVWSSIGKFVGNATGLSSIIDAGTAIAGLITGNKSEKRQIAAQQQANQANIASQERINQRNIASQEKINQQNLDFAQNINDIMRYDSKHAISDKKTDLQRAGYSAADPSLQGFSAATLAQPQLEAPQSVAPQVEPEYNASMASSKLNSILGLRGAATEIALMKAQAKSQNANATGQEIENAWKDVEHKTGLAMVNQNLTNAVKEGRIKELTATRMLLDMEQIQSQTDILEEELKQKKFATEHQAEQYLASLSNLQASTTDLLSSAGLKDKQRAVAEFELQIKKVEAEMAKFGINFNDNSVFGTMLKLAHTGHLSTLTDDVLGSIGDVIMNVIERLAKVIKVPQQRGAALSGASGGLIGLMQHFGLI